MSESRVRRVAITGASSGIGAACARHFSNRGDHVIGLSRRASGPASPGFEARVLDVRESDACSEVFASVGELDILVLNAGICRTAPLDSDSALQTWNAVRAVNVDGIFHCMQAARLRAGASVVMVSSGLGKVGRAGYAAYAASKHAVLGIMRCAALEWAPKVRVNAVCPGWVDTAMARADLERSSTPRERVEHGIPLGRFVQEDEVAQLVAFLCDAQAITGRAFDITGGELAA